MLSDVGQLHNPAHIRGVAYTDGFITCYLSYPSNIKKIDIQILRKQLDLLELLAE